MKRSGFVWGGIATVVAIATVGTSGGKVADANVGVAPGPQACVVGTRSVRLAETVTTSGGLATDSLDMEPGAVANGGANINNVGGASVRISGATINGAVSIAGAAPSTANGELLNGGKIVGPVTTGAGQASSLATMTVTPGTTSVTENSSNAPLTLTPGSYSAVNVNGSTVTFIAGTYNLASLTINSGSTVVFNTTGGAINVNLSGNLNVNGGNLSATNPTLVTFYSNGTVTINAGISTFPGTVTAPHGAVTIGSRITVQGCIGGQTVDVEPNSTVAGTASTTGCADGAREGFLDLNAFPNIAGCSGGWSVPGVMPFNPGTAPTCPTIATHDTVTPACGLMGGNNGLNPNGTGCDVADLCAPGWHVCNGAADVASHSPTGCNGATTASSPPLFFTSRQSSTGCFVCATGTSTDPLDCTASSCANNCQETAITSNDIFGCGNIGDTPTAACDDLNETGGNLCDGLTGTNWSCTDDGSGFCEAYVAVHSGPTFGGALCCTNP